MKIELVRSGGFGNIVLRRAVDTDELPADEAAEFEALVRGIDLAGLSALSPIPARGADRFQYDLVVTRGDESRHVSIGEGEIGPELHELFTRILEQGGRPTA